MRRAHRQLGVEYVHRRILKPAAEPVKLTNVNCVALEYRRGAWMGCTPSGSLSPLPEPIVSLGAVCSGIGQGDRAVIPSDERQPGPIAIGQRVLVFEQVNLPADGGHGHSETAWTPDRKSTRLTSS